MHPGIKRIISPGAITSNLPGINLLKKERKKRSE
jgi:hypothetical protein